MRVIGRRSAIAAAVLFTLAPSGFADTHADVVDLFASMSAALTEDPPNSAAFMKAFDRTMPEYDELNRRIKSLVLGAFVSSSIDFVKDDGTDAKRSVDVDWYMELRSKQESGPMRQVRKVLHCELAKQGKHWRITSLSPVSFFQNTP